MAVTIGPYVYTGKSRLRKLRREKRIQKRYDKLAKKKLAAEKKAQEKAAAINEALEVPEVHSDDDSSTSSRKSSESDGGSLESIPLSLASRVEELAPLLDAYSLPPSYYNRNISHIAIARKFKLMPVISNDFIGFGKQIKRIEKADPEGYEEEMKAVETKEVFHEEKLCPPEVKVADEEETSECKTRKRANMCCCTIM